MEKEEKAKVILDYDKYYELLERVKWTDIKSNSVALDAYDKAKKEDEKYINELKETVASLEKDKSNLYYNLSKLQEENVLLRDLQIKACRESRREGYSEFAWRHGDEILDKVMNSLDMSLKTIPALSFWNYFTGKADRVFCDKIRSCVGNSLNRTFSDYK